MTIAPAAENTLLLGTEVAGIAKYFWQSLPKCGCTKQPNDRHHLLIPPFLSRGLVPFGPVSCSSPDDQKHSICHLKYFSAFEMAVASNEGLTASTNSFASLYSAELKPSMVVSEVASSSLMAFLSLSSRKCMRY